MKCLWLVLCVVVLCAAHLGRAEDSQVNEQEDSEIDNQEPSVEDKKQTKRGVHHLGHFGLPEEWHGFHGVHHSLPSVHGLSYSLPPTYAYRYGYNRPWSAYSKVLPTAYQPVYQPAVPSPITLLPGSASVQSYSVNYPRFPFVQRRPVFNAPLALPPRPVLPPVQASLTPIANYAPPFSYNLAPVAPVAPPAPTPFFVPQRPVVSYAPTPLPQPAPFIIPQRPVFSYAPAPLPQPAPFIVPQRPIIPVAVPFHNYQRPKVPVFAPPRPVVANFAPIRPVQPTSFPVPSPQPAQPFNPSFSALQPQFVPVPVPPQQHPHYQPPLPTLATPSHHRPTQFAIQLGTSSGGGSVGWRPIGVNVNVRPLQPTQATVNQHRPSVGLLPPYSFSSTFANTPNNVGALNHQGQQQPHHQTQIYISSTPSPNNLIDEGSYSQPLAPNHLYTQEQEDDYERQLQFHQQQHQQQLELQQQQQQLPAEEQSNAFNGQGYDEASNQGRYAGPSSYDVEINGHRGY